MHLSGVAGTFLRAFAIGALAVGHRAENLPPQVGRIAERRLGVDRVVHRGTWGTHRA